MKAFAKPLPNPHEVTAGPQDVLRLATLRLGFKHWRFARGGTGVPSWRSARDAVREAGIPFCCLFMLAVSGCGGGDDGGAGPPSTGQILYSFGASSTDAMGPNGTLILGSDGNFYGTTTAGGIDGAPAHGDFGYGGYGTVFKITPAGEETVLYRFASGTDGDSPVVLTQGSDLNFYGTTGGGGAHGSGTVFTLTPEGVETILYSFTGGSDGDVPEGGLIQGSDGNLYGTAHLPPGAAGTDVLFKLTSEGVLTIVHTFTGGSDGLQPAGQLIQDGSGNIYGVTTYGGTSGNGTVFKITLGGVETILHSFFGPDGSQPVAGLIMGSDGNLYGTTLAGGANKYGTVFKVTPGGVETVLYSFSGTATGYFPSAALTQGSDGNLYGTTADGGTNHGGLIFQITPAGVFTVLYSLTGFGDQPLTNMVQGSDGNLYATSYNGGAYNCGYFFRYVLN